MNRGPGRIERAIRALMAANPDLAFTTNRADLESYQTAHFHVYRLRQKTVMAVFDQSFWLPSSRALGWRW
jgi:hypothetical protein